MPQATFLVTEEQYSLHRKKVELWKEWVASELKAWMKKNGFGTHRGLMAAEAKIAEATLGSILSTNNGLSQETAPKLCFLTHLQACNPCDMPEIPHSISKGLKGVSATIKQRIISREEWLHFLEENSQSQEEFLLTTAASTWEEFLMTKKLPEDEMPFMKSLQSCPLLAKPEETSEGHPEKDKDVENLQPNSSEPSSIEAPLSPSLVEPNQTDVYVPNPSQLNQVSPEFLALAFTIQQSSSAFSSSIADAVIRRLREEGLQGNHLVDEIIKRLHEESLQISSPKIEQEAQGEEDPVKEFLILLPKILRVLDVLINKETPMEVRQKLIAEYRDQMRMAYLALRILGASKPEDIEDSLELYHRYKGGF